jgi:hypothetical protein
MTHRAASSTMSDSLKGECEFAKNGWPVVHRLRFAHNLHQRVSARSTCRTMAEEKRLRYADVR